MGVSAGTATLKVAPELIRTFSKDLVNQMGGPATRAANQAGTQAGRTFGQKFGSQLAGPTAKAADDAGGKTGKRFGGKFSASAASGVGALTGRLRLVGPAMLAAFGGAAIINGIKDVTNEAREAAVVGRITEARLKSTGGVANVTGAQVAGLAERLSNLTGVDDELIQSGENLMLTFTGVRNEAGKGNDIFNRATRLAVDLAAGMNNGAVTTNGLKTANIQLGKALEDPIRGITALRRSGVSFTEQEKEQIKTLVDHGDKLGAQKIILAAVQKQFGGTAAASADAGKRFGVFVANIKEAIGTKLLPIINSLLGFLVTNLPKAFGVVAAAVRPVIGAFQRAGQVLGGILGPALASIGKSIAPAAAAFTKSLLPGLKSLWHVVKNQVLPAVKVLAAIIGVALFAALKYVLPLLLRIAGPVLGALAKSLSLQIQWISNVVRFVGRLIAWLARWVTGTKTTGAAVRELGRRVGVFASNMTKQWQGITRTVTNSLSFLKRSTVSVLSFMIRLWLRWAGSIINAAAKAMGWVPGIGPKLRRAQAQFHEFAAGVNRNLDRLRDQTINVKVRSSVEIADSVRKYAKLANVPGFHAKGGAIHGPGTGTSDSIPAMLSSGEHVWTAKEVQKAGGHAAVEGMRRQVVRGYARGGPVLDVPVRFQKSGDILKQFYHPMVAATRRMGTKITQGFAKLIGKGLSKAINEGIGGGKAGIKNFIKAVDSHPYVWGGVGPGGYDCSGLVGEVYARHTGRPSFRRYFTTSTIGGMGFARGPGGVLQIGVSPGHHMAGRYGGLGFEAESTRTGIKIGAAASPPGSFPVQYHLARGGRVKAAEQLARLGVEVGGDPGGMWLRKNPKLGIYDTGGMLPPGASVAVNRTGKPERVTSHRQEQAMVSWLKRISGQMTSLWKTSHAIWLVLSAGGGRAAAAKATAAPRKTAARRARSPAYVDYGTVSQATWNRLLAQGWRGRAGDHHERLYRPAGVYDKGGWLMPGQLAINKTSTPERVVGPGQSMLTRADAKMLADAIVVALHAQPVRAYMDPNQARHAIQVVQGRSGVKPANQLK